MENSDGCILATLAFLTGLSVYIVLMFGISYAIAYLVVSMGFLSVSVFKLALLICLIKMVFFNYRVNFDNPKERKGNE